MKRKNCWGFTVATGLALATGLSPSDADACGGFFCSQAQPVNQAAERIVFAQNQDGTVTAVIEIKYAGPSENFSWLLPITSVPKGTQLAVASNLAFERLQQATNPQYTLTTRVEGECDEEADFGGGFGSGGAFSGDDSAAGGAGGESNGDAGVTLEASGLVGAFEWAVISFNQSLPNPADAAVAWLENNGYDVPQGAPGLLGPYLADGMYLLALRLKKGANTGSIRPIALTYDGTKPMIPVKLTAVAANEDMGVLTWILGDTRAVPKNYYGLELNEARINWFNANQNYNDVVIAAANDAGGQGFVTEYAQRTTQLADAVWSREEERQWQAFRGGQQVDVDRLLIEAVYAYSPWDGFRGVLDEHVTPPADVSIDAVQRCPDCFSGYALAPAAFLSALEANVIAPARLIQGLIDSHFRVTRLYTTLSAEEMTVDPLFTFNGELPDVSHLHAAERVIECGAGYYEFQAPWRIELPQGGIVRGGPSDIGRWPSEFDSQPANRRILRHGESGPGKVLEDNSSTIDSAINTYSDELPIPTRRPRPLDVPTTRVPRTASPPLSATPSLTENDDVSSPKLAPNGSCSVSRRPVPSLLGLTGLLGFVGLALRRRRRR